MATYCPTSLVTLKKGIAIANRVEKWRLGMLALCHGVFMHKNGDKAELSRVNEAYRNFVKVQLVPLPGLEQNRDHRK